MLLTSALDDAALHVNSGAPPLSGPGLEALARQYMEVQAIIKRWARRYDERLLEQLIYMPAVSAAEFDRADWMRDWTARPRAAPQRRSPTARAAIAWSCSQVDGHPARVTSEQDRTRLCHRKGTAARNSSSRPNTGASSSSARRWPD